MTKVPWIQKGQRIYDKCRKTIANLPKSFGNEAAVTSSSEYDINKKKNFNSFKSMQTHFVSSLNETPESPLSTKKLSQVTYLKEKLKKVKEAVKGKILNLIDSSGSFSSGESEITGQLNFFPTKQRRRRKGGGEREKVKRFKFSWIFQTAGLPWNGRRSLWTIITTSCHSLIIW